MIKLKCAIKGYDAATTSKARLDWLYCQFHFARHRTIERRLELRLLKRRRDPILNELASLLRGATDEAARLEQRAAVNRISCAERRERELNGLELGLDRIEVRVCAYPLDEVVLEAEVFDLMCGFMGEHLRFPSESVPRVDVEKTAGGGAHPDLLVCLLAIPAGLDERHDEVFSRHEGQLLRDAARDYARVDNEALAHVLEGAEDNVRGEECLRERDPPVRAAEASAEAKDPKNHESETCRRACAQTTACPRSSTRFAGGP